MCDYIDDVVQQLMDYGVNKDTIVEKFCKKFKLLSNEMSETYILDTAYKLVGKRLVHENLSIRKRLWINFLKPSEKLGNSQLMIVYLNKAHIPNPVSHSLLRQHTKFQLHLRKLLLTVLIGMF